MVFSLICLTWFDTVTLVFAFVALILAKVLNADTNSDKTTAKINGNIKKQKSENCEDLPATPDSSARHSISSLNKGDSTHPPSPDTISDDYNEDEDTLSLENLFPCDQTEIYASKKISFIIDELIQTEANYVNNLLKGISNYGELHERQDLPETLQGLEKQQQLLGNVREILKLHQEKILPMMLRNQRDLKTLFDEFAASFDKSEFYCYVIFTMTKKTSMQLRQENREWFQSFESRIGDKLGIDSFLVQPIQRLTRYPLLLQQFISEFYKSGISCKPVLVSVCKLETRMRRVLEVVNQAEEVPTIEELGELRIMEQGRFQRSTEFEMYSYRNRKKFHGKVFLFDRCLVCAEVRKKHLTYRQHFTWDAVKLQLGSSKTVVVQLKTAAGIKEEYELTATEASSVTRWMRSVRHIIEVARTDSEMEGKFSLPMDLVLGVVIAIWMMWLYL